MSLTQNSHSLPRGATAEVIRPLTAADLALIPAPGSSGTPHIKRIRDAHHRLAVMVAKGCSLKEINEVTGYSFSRISILKSDPSFANLVDFYRDKAIEDNIEEVSDFTRRLVAFTGDCIEEMHDRLLDTPETIAHDTLTDWSKLGLDRTGHGAQSKSFSLHATLDLAGKVAAGRRRALELSAAPAVKPALLQPPNSTGRAAREDSE